MRRESFFSYWNEKLWKMVSLKVARNNDGQRRGVVAPWRKRLLVGRKRRRLETHKRGIRGVLRKSEKDAQRRDEEDDQLSILSLFAFHSLSSFFLAFQPEMKESFK